MLVNNIVSNSVTITSMSETEGGPKQQDENAPISREAILCISVFTVFFVILLLVSFWTYLNKRWQNRALQTQSRASSPKEIDDMDAETLKQSMDHGSLYDMSQMLHYHPHGANSGQLSQAGDTATILESEMDSCQVDEERLPIFELNERQTDSTRPPTS